MTNIIIIIITDIIKILLLRNVFLNYETQIERYELMFL